MQSSTSHRPRPSFRPTSLTCRIWLVFLAALCPQAVLGAETPPASSDEVFPLRAGDLEMTLSRRAEGLALAGLKDTLRGQPLAAKTNAPLFVLTMRHTMTRQEKSLVADEGWQAVQITRTRNGWDLDWARPKEVDFGGLAVRAQVRSDPAAHAFHWTLQVENPPTQWSVWRVVFPQIKVGRLGNQSALLFPRGPGEVQRGIWEREFKYHGAYPGGWCSMQFMAAYREEETPTGLYLAVHDPWGGAKDLDVSSDPTHQAINLRFVHPAPDMGLSGNTFVLGGEAVWQLLRGDWFDAARIYRAWAMKHARWWPRRGVDGRTDTPRWMRDLNAWALGGGAAGECVEPVKKFQQYLGLPIGFHWYNWHQIPFDNDYPHYFPAKEGFAAGVSTLQQASVHVMPYINGRLWDLYDRGARDWEFTSLALPASTKDAHGQPHAETYGSKETDGSPVKLAVMCPSTRLWQTTVRDTVRRLLKEVKTSGVYIDQVAAASPVLCMDPSHRHPLGGGHWWNQGYWTMLDDIRRHMPSGAMLTTECNGEPFIRWFDGYLTWHWQYDGQVPAFPAVYGGALQMFGRAYRGGPTKDLALRMKAAQQLVFGEQLGWIGPEIVAEKDNAEFFRQMVRARARLNRYFVAGEMARPPKLSGMLPRVRADWQWSGEWPVSTDAVLTGAWQLPSERRMVCLFVNVSDQPLRAAWRWDASQHGIQAVQLTTRTWQVDSPPVVESVAQERFERELEFPPRLALLCELQW